VGYNWYLYNAGQSSANVTFALYLLYQSHEVYFSFMFFLGKPYFAQENSEFPTLIGGIIPIQQKELLIGGLVFLMKYMHF
jgi:hypothetical protein